ncbi:alcohol dehydrogenase catalytic domain-containing protein [Streptomyces massasporeus]|uniref:alcohol dehydrogenase catalytic domain-containing protein n=1 Tax=Streptomyces massasporeus TaxID=67324 RepID=UPI003647E3F6
MNQLGACESCRAGQERYCLKGDTLVFGALDPAEPGAHTQGGYSEAIVAPEDFVVRVPKTLDPAAPLRCCAPASRPTPHSNGSAPGPAPRSRSSAWAGSATSA